VEDDDTGETSAPDRARRARGPRPNLSRQLSIRVFAAGRYNDEVRPVSSTALSLLLLLLTLPAKAPAQTGDDLPSSAGVGAAAGAHDPLVVFLGDSLTAGLGVNEDQAYPALVGRRLSAADHPVRVLNAGVSGVTSAGGLRRLEWLLAQHPDVVVVALGSNDGLRGLPLEETEGNLRRIVTRAREAGCRVLLLGMMVPPNYGPDYAPKFAAMFPRLAKELAVPLVPFLLEGVGGRPELNQGDGIHPTADGHRIMAQTVSPQLLTIVSKLDSVRR
jgi:acyl-CoA thioesterase-1